MASSVSRSPAANCGRSSPVIRVGEDANGPGLLSELARVNTLFVLYLWLSYRGQGRRWWERSSALLMVGLALLFLVSQYALHRLLSLSAVEYSVEMIRLAP